GGRITGRVADAAALRDVMRGYETGARWWAPPPARAFAAEVGATPGRLRVAVAVEPPLDVPVAPACAAAARRAGKLLADLGHDVEERAPDWREPDLFAEFCRVWQLGAALVEVGDPELLDPINRAAGEAARATSSTEYATAVVRLTAYARRVVAFWESIDVLVTPTLALPAVPVGYMTGRETELEAAFWRG